MQAVAAKEAELGELRARYEGVTKQYDEAVHRINLAKQVGGAGRGRNNLRCRHLGGAFVPNCGDGGLRCAPIAPWRTSPAELLLRFLGRPPWASLALPAGPRASSV